MRNETAINKDELVDIRTITINSDLPKNERIADYLRQIKDPYHYRCGEFTVTVKFAEKGPTLEECLRLLIS
jgi:hypothetical protein